MKKIKWILVFCFCLSRNISGAQTSIFEKHIRHSSGSICGSLVQDYDSNFIFIDYIPFNSTLMKVNEFGDTILTKSLTSLNGDMAIQLSLAGNGEYYLSGSYAIIGGEWDFFLCKLNSHYDTLWTKHYGNTGTDQSQGVIQYSDSTLLMGGAWHASGGFSGEPSDISLIKLDYNGDTIWKRVYGGAGDDYGMFRQLNNNSIVFAGASNSINPTKYCPYIFEVDSLGNQIISLTIQPVSNLDTIVGSGGVFSNLDNSIDILLGAKINGVSGGVLCKMDSLNGAIISAKQYSIANSIVFLDHYYQMFDGSYVFCGDKRGVFNDPSTWDGAVLKIDPMGNVAWARTYGKPNQADYFVFLTTVKENSIYAMGVSEISGIGETYLVKMDSLGNSGCDSSTFSVTVNDVTALIHPVSIPPMYLQSPVNTGAAPISITDGSNAQITTRCSGFAGEAPVQDPLSSRFSASPNPASNRTIISYELDANKKHIQFFVFDVTGRLIREYNPTDDMGKFELNLSDITSGVYFLNMIIEGKRYAAQKLIVLQH